jgi:hypothetical protein
MPIDRSGHGAATRGTRVLAACAACLLVAAGAAVAALPPALSRQLERMPEPLQRELRQREARLGALPPATRAALQQRLERWDALPPAERALLREHWEAWRALPPGEQQAVREAAAAFAALPPERQDELRRQFAALPADEQRGWLLGPRVGAQWAGLQPLLMQVPADEREALLRTLQAMPETELRDLAVLAQRTPPQERETLRHDLVRTGPGNRAAWLRMRLER